MSTTDLEVPDKSNAPLPVEVAGSNIFKAAVNFVLSARNFHGNGEIGSAQSGIMPQTEDVVEFCQSWLLLINKGCRRFARLCAPRASNYPSDIRNHRLLRPLLGRLETICDLRTLAGWLGQKPVTTAEVTSSLQLYLEAIVLQSRIRKFSHGHEHDVVNCFLAPARLLGLAKSRLAMEQRDNWKAVWEKFDEGVLSVVDLPCLSLGAELNEAGEAVKLWLGGDSESATVEALERSMLLLTQIRTLADQKNTCDGARSDSRVEPVGRGGGFRVLVADDHARAWRPVFMQLEQEMNQEGFSIQFDFSLEGRYLASGTVERVPISYGRYDLVVLDVFLGIEDGRIILNRLRRDFSRLPVLLWTTSRDEEITGEASLANGILFKKTLDWRDFSEAIKSWAGRGRAMRSRILPNSFFNHTIQSPVFRELAVNCHEWCLKQLDSFHALDGEYFRFFTDHGGRHIVKLLELLENGLSPFLFDDETVLASEPVQRELELLGLYLAVVAHELGMFPMKVRGKVEDFQALGRAYLNDVRELHAVRGMVLLHDQAGDFWNDRAGKKLGAELHKNGLAARLAVLVGYHARVFASLDEAHFLVLASKDAQSAENSLNKRLLKLQAPSAALAAADTKFLNTYTSLAKEFCADAIAKNRLRRQCAIFRFIDALDVSFTRNPAEFLIGRGRTHATQYVEGLKRELCLEAGIKSGNVTVQMAAGAPESESVKAILEYLASHQSSVQIAATTARSLLDEEAIVEICEHPWAPPSHKQAWEGPDLESRSALCLQKPLDGWLSEVWSVIVKKRGEQDFVSHLKRLGVLDAAAHEPALTFLGAQKIASVTALSVAGELLDEYQAICQAGLTERIRLTQSGWNWGCWDGDKLPEGLGILAEALTGNRE